MPCLAIISRCSSSRPGFSFTRATTAYMTVLRGSGFSNARMLPDRPLFGERRSADMARLRTLGGERAGIGAASRRCYAERNDPHEEQTCTELEVHVATGRDEATLAEDRDRFYCLL